MEAADFSQVSLSTTVMNRLEMLEHTLPNWLRFNFQNIYILNWNSDDTKELHAFVESLKDSRVIIEDVTGKRTSYFMAAISRNMAAERCLELTRPRWLFQIDSDILINESFRYLPLNDEILYMSPHTRLMVRPGLTDDASTVFNKYSNRIEVQSAMRMRFGAFGSCLMPAHKVFQWGYYNENLVENNWFDVLYLSQYYKNDYENIWYFRNELTHIDHSNEDRMRNGTEKDMVRAVEINKALSALPPYRYPYEVKRLGLIEIN
jgi:hypothetical protein